VACLLPHQNFVSVACVCVCVCSSVCVNGFLLGRFCGPPLKEDYSKVFHWRIPAQFHATQNKSAAAHTQTHTHTTTSHHSVIIAVPIRDESIGSFPRTWRGHSDLSIRKPSPECHHRNRHHEECSRSATKLPQGGMDGVLV
jgi:hypothetical protein